MPPSPEGSPQGPADTAVCNTGRLAAAGPLGGALVLCFDCSSTRFFAVGGAEEGRSIADGSLSEALSLSSKEALRADSDTRSNKLRLCLANLGGGASLRFCAGAVGICCTGAGTEGVAPKDEAGVREPHGFNEGLTGATKREELGADCA